MKKMDWNVTRNVGQGIRVHAKPENELSKERTTFMLKKNQREFLNAYCQQSGLSLSEVIRFALQDYFEKVGFRFETGNDEDSRQLKMFNEV